MDRSRDAAADAQRWLDLGRDVLIRGEEGSGRSTALDDLVRRVTAGGTHVLTIHASRVTGAPSLTPLLLHELRAQPRPGARSAVPELVDALAVELDGRRNLLAVDDLDHLDPGSLVVVEELLRRTSCLFIATVGEVPPEGSAVRAALASRAPAEVRVAPLGEWSLVALLTERLQGQPALALTSAVMNQSAGHPAAALALVDAGRWAGAVERVNGFWDLVSPLEDVPHDAVVHALIRQLPDDQIEGLRLLSWTGPMDTMDAGELLGEEVLDALVVRGRLTTVSAHGDELVVVSPPALAHGLLRALTPAQTRRGEARLRERFGPDYAPRPPNAIDPAIPERLAGQLASEGETSTWTSTTAGLILDRVSVQRALRRAAWREARSVRHTVLLLDAISGAPDRREIREALATVTASPDDDPDDVARVLEQQAQWTTWSGEDDDDTFGPLAERLGVQPDARSDLSAGRELVNAVRLTIVNGRPRDALHLLGSASPRLTTVRTELDALRTDALLFAGRFEEALSWADARLSEALSTLDATTVRTHTAALAGLKIVTGRGPEAWSSLSVALRLGLPGPFEQQMPLRVAALGAIVPARAGNIRFARLLLRELENRELVDDPLLCAVVAWAKAEVHFAQDEIDAGNDLLWEHGVQAAAAGHLTAAMVCWTAIASIFSSERLATILEKYSVEELPLFEPIIGLHRALATGPSASVIEAIARMRSTLGPAQTRVVLERLAELREAEGLAPLRAAQVAELAGRQPGYGLDPSVDRLVAGVELLSDREREIALYARAGLSNREIAARLFLSVRTVESHMYRALRKLGLGSRTDLVTQWEPDEA